MHRRSLALLLALASPALAQQPAGPAQAEPPAKKDDAETPARHHVRSIARYLFQHLLLGDVRGIAPELVYPFQLEDKRYGTADELVAAWVKELRSKRTDLVALYDIEVLDFAELEQKHGKPPARLGLNLASTPGYAAVGNLGGHAAIFLFRQTPEGWRAFAYTD
jgi:hypothetical protein